MAVSVANLSHLSQRPKSRFLLVVLIAVHAIFNLTLNPVGASEEKVSERLALPLMGATLAQPALFAIWAAVGPGPTLMRIPLSFVSAAVVFFATVPKRWNVFEVHQASSENVSQKMLMELAFFGVVLITMLIVQKVMGWRILLLG
jgi:hypothetical protein